MQDSWWSSIGIAKPRMIMVVELSMLKTLRPKLPLIEIGQNVTTLFATTCDY
jgi:hypothetical protein